MGCIPIRPLRLWQWETAPNGLPQRQRLIHPSAQHRSNYLRSTQILCEGDSFANFKVLVWGIGACWILSGDGGYWVPSSCSPFALLNLAVTILFSFYSFSFYFFFYFFSFFGRCHLCTPPCLTSVSGSHLLQTYGTLIFTPGDPVLVCNPGNTPWPPIQGWIAFFACLGALALG